MLLLIIGLLLSIVLHEFAHLFVAKLIGCPIEIVSLGFGKTLYQFNYKKIIYKINLLFILGGDCQLKGERVYSKAKNAYCNLRYLYKVYIGLAGCIANLLLGALCLLSPHHSILLLGYLNIGLGIVNLFPIPCLDGSTLAFIWLTKFYKSYKQGYSIYMKLQEIALIFWIAFNILSIPLFIFYMKYFHYNISSIF